MAQADWTQTEGKRVAIYSDGKLTLARITGAKGRGRSIVWPPVPLPSDIAKRKARPWLKRGNPRAVIEAIS